MQVSNEPPQNFLAPSLNLSPSSRGMGASGLPGDFSSLSRFVQAVFIKEHAVNGDSEGESVSQFFHILNAVAQPRGCVRLEDGKYVITIYSCCINTDKGIYYYTTYENSQIHTVDMHRENLDSAALISFPLKTTETLSFQN